MDLFTKLRIIWDELESFRPNPFCSCSIQYSCGALLIVMERKKEYQIIQFLRGLNDQYANMRSSILLMDSLPLITKVFSYVVQQERQTLGSAGVLGSLNLESRDYSSINAASSKQSTNCSFCGRLGHTESVCYRKNGFSMNGSNNKNNQNRSAKMCSHCGKTGHTVDVCYRKHGYPLGHKFHNNNNSSSINSSVTGDMQVTAIDQQCQDAHAPSFTSQQYQALLALIQQPSHGASSSTPRVNQIGTFSPYPGTSTSTNLGNLPHLFCNSVSNSTAPWILDSGATDHVSSSLANFSSYVSINPIVVKLPTSQEVLTTHSGVVKFSYSFLLTNVLYIPSFTFNLISISKLASSLNCKLTFFSNKCFIQDAITKRMIGTVDVVAGLYKLPLLSSILSTTLLVQLLLNHYVISCL